MNDPSALSSLAIILLLAIVNERAIEFIARPAKRYLSDRFPTEPMFQDWWWLFYVGVGTGFALSWVNGFNLFEGVFPSLAVGKFLTAVGVGGGATLIHEFVSARDGDPTIIVPEVEVQPPTSFLSDEDVQRLSIQVADMLSASFGSPTPPPVPKSPEPRDPFYDLADAL